MPKEMSSQIITNNPAELQIPVLGSVTTAKLIEYILSSIIDEATAVNFYDELLKKAPNELHQEFILHAHEDELKHLQFFTRLYMHYTNKRPNYETTPVIYDNYEAGLLRALKDELNATEFYRDVQLHITIPEAHDIFYLAMVDEIKHASMFSTLYSTMMDNNRY